MSGKHSKTRLGEPGHHPDRHIYYQRAVQSVDTEIDFVDATFKTLRGRRASWLREDFCGTANTACEWTRRRTGNHAVGLDIDEATLAWGREHNLSRLTPGQRSRVHLVNGSVLDPHPELSDGREGGTGFDCILAMNFSYWCFKQRATLLAYFRRVRESLAADGVFFLDFYGGPDALRELRERRRIGGKKRGFTYVWHQEKYDPISGDILCHIDFRFDDGSALKRAFTYDWRLWTIPEIRDLLTEAGFARVGVYWEGDDGKGGGDGVFTRAEHGEACPAYICYIAAEK